MRLQRGNGASVCIGDELDGALAQRGSVGVAVHHGSVHTRDQQAWAADCSGNRWIRLGSNELRVRRGQFFESALLPCLASSG